MAGGNGTHPLLTPLAPPLRVPVRRFRPNVAGVLRRVCADGAYVVLSRRGIAIASVVPVGVLDLLAATDEGLRGGTRVPVRRFRRDLPAVLRRVRDEPAYVTLTRRGLPVAVVVPLHVLDLLDATEALLARRNLAAAGDLHDAATAARDVLPRAGPVTHRESRPGRSVPRLG